MAGSPDLPPGGNARYWLFRGIAAAFSIPGLILASAFVGFAGLAKEAGLTLPETVFMTGVVWALPAKVVLVSGIISGNTLAAAAFAVALSSVRLTPMVVALVRKCADRARPGSPSISCRISSRSPRG